MSQSYETCLFDPDFRIGELRLHPGRPVSSERGRIRLAGGFPALFPDSDTPLSPTLQVNKDLARETPAALERIGQAELLRHGRSQVRSYTVTPSLTLCAIGDDPVRLNEFLDTYGGILEIEPLLYEGEDDRFAQVTEIDIEPREPGYLVRATRRAPIDFQSCTYCGACGPACPERCISPTLRVDFGACTFCRDCESACPAGAVDIYGVEHREIAAPAVIVIGDPDLDLPEERTSIYSETAIEAYLKTLVELEVEEAVSCDHSICHYSAKLDGGCTLCVQSCRFGAITRSRDGIVVDSMICTECGTCAATCPTGAMVYRRFDDDTFNDYIGSLDPKAGTTMILGTGETLHQLWWHGRASSYDDALFVEHPCPEALSPFHFLYLLSRGAGRVIVATPDGNGSEPAAIGAATALIEALTGAAGLISLNTVAEISAGLPVAGPDLSIPPTGDGFANRRTALAELLTGWYSRFARPVELDASYGSFGTVRCDPERCTHCFACLNECRIGALRAGSDARSLHFTGSLCVGCGACAAICPENALEVETTTFLDADFGTTVELAVAEPMLCRECGKDFGTRKSFAKVMRVLERRNMADKGYFEYCETCRVVKIFEEDGA